MPSLIAAPARHFDARPRGVAPSLVVLHRTEARTAASTLAWFADPASRVSAHALIDLDGTTYRCVRDEARAWHAGRSVWCGVEGVNDFSFGLELVGVGAEPYPDPQLWAAALLVSGWCASYAIPLNAVVGHAHVAPGRKTDPEGFPWCAWLLTVASILDLEHDPDEPAPGVPADDEEGRSA